MFLKDIARKVLPAALWETLRQGRVYRHVRRFKPYTVRNHYAGVPMEIWICDGLSQGWYGQDWPTPPEIDLLSRAKLRAGARVFDCGAHQGVMALMLNSRVQPGGHVVAVEGMAHNCRAAEENCRLNGAQAQVTVVHAAVTAESGKINFFEGLNGSVALRGGGVEVEAISIDDLTDRFGPPDVLFIDVEGFECEALKGAQRTLREHRPDCYVEVHVHEGLEASGGSAQQVIAAFDPAVYQLWAWRPGRDTPARIETVQCELMQSLFYLLALSRDRAAIADQTSTAAPPR